MSQKFAIVKIRDTIYIMGSKTTEALLLFADISVEIFEVFDPRKTYRKPIKEYRKWRIDKKISANTANKLLAQGLIEVNQASYKLTDKAKRKIRDTNIKELKINHPKKWDKYWRVVSFDIPEKHKIARNILRVKLRELGFIRLQDSVYAHPFPCFNEIDYISSTYNIKQYVLYIESKKIDPTSELRLCKSFSSLITDLNYS